MTGPRNMYPAGVYSDGISLEVLEARRTFEPNEGIRAVFAYAAECELRRIMEEGAR